MSLSNPTRTIDRDSSEDDMVATLLGLKASQLAGMIEPCGARSVQVTMRP